MKILILAAGYGTRLYPLIKDTAKPLLDIAGRPLINHILDVVGHVPDLNEILVVTNNKFHKQFEQWAKENTQYAAPIKVINDLTESPDDRLGSVGDIRFVLESENLDDDLLVIGGDNLFDYSFDDFIQFALSKKPFVTIGLFDITKKEDATKFGVVQIDEVGKIVSFDEKPEHPKSSLIAMCSYFMPRETLAYLAEYIRSSKKTDKAGDYIKWLVQEKGVYGFKFEGKWYDIGSIEAYNEAQEKFKT